MSDRYCGFTNRETWALNRHLQGDRFLFMMACDVTASLAKRDIHPREVGERLVAMTRAVAYAGDELGLRILRDVGSFWRVDEYELGSLWLDSVAVMGEFSS